VTSFAHTKYVLDSVNDEYGLSNVVSVQINNEHVINLQMPSCCISPVFDDQYFYIRCHPLERTKRYKDLYIPNRSFLNVAFR